MIGWYAAGIALTGLHVVTTALGLASALLALHCDWLSVCLFVAHAATVTAAVFAPQPNLFFNAREDAPNKDSLLSTDSLTGKGPYCQAIC